LGITGTVYLVGMGILGAGLLSLAIATLKENQLTATAARRVFLGSLVYHPLVLILLLMDTIRL
jgi:heme O synthase-like polyprenyltransferase